MMHLINHDMVVTDHAFLNWFTLNLEKGLRGTENKED